MKRSVLILSACLLLATACKNDLENHKNYEENIPMPKEGRIVAFMIDAARCMGKPDFYKKTISFCKKWGYNAIVFRLTDDQGCSYRFESHPELIMHKNALDREQMVELVAFANENGIDMIPEIESFGHARFITNTERYAYLDDTKTESIFNAVTPVSDTTRLLMKDLYTEITEIFTSEYIHIGCDEVNWGHNPLTKKALESRSKDQIWAEYVNTLNSYVKELGKTTIIWGDMVIYHHREALELLDKEIIILDWGYANDDPLVYQENAKWILNSGHKLIGGSAVNFCAWGPRVNEAMIKNLKAYHIAYSRINDPNILGYVVTNWMPSRFVANGQWDSYALAAMVLNSDTGFAMVQGLEIFSHIHYAAGWGTKWANVYSDLYEDTPPRHGCGNNLEPREMFLPVPWFNEEMLIAQLPGGKRKNVYEGIYDRFVMMQSEVKKNIGDYNDMVLSVEYLSHLVWRKNALVDIKKVYSAGDEEELCSILEDIALNDSLITDKIIEAWDRSRPEDSPLKEDYYIYSNPSDAMMTTMIKACRYSQYLNKNKEELMKILSGKL